MMNPRAIRSASAATAPSSRAFSLIEILVVIAIIGAIAALVVGGASHARETAVRSRVKTELSQLVTAIESYHKKFGFYPPDNPNNPAKPPLYYELTGNVDHQLALGAGMTAEFSVKGIVNAQRDENGRDVTFLPNLGVEGKNYKEINATPKAYALTVPAPGDGPNPNLNLWRYVSKNPTNNPERFDLWAEVMIGNKKVVIGNWKD